MTFNEIVKADLDDFFRKINPVMREKGIEWNTIDGHYWVEIRIFDEKRRKTIKLER